MKIYVKFEIPNTVKEFIEKLFTCTKGSSYCCLETYKDEKCTDIQCAAGKYRSFDDILVTVQTYFPECTPKELLHVLLLHKISINRPNGNTRTYTPMLAACSTMRRIRIYYDLYPPVYYLSDVEKYNSIYSWQELLSMLGLTTKQEIIDYIKKHEK